MTPPTILLCRGNVFTEPLPNSEKGIHTQTHGLYLDTKRTAWKIMRPRINLLLGVFAGRQRLGNQVPNPLLNKGKRIHLKTRRLKKGKAIPVTGRGDP
jgi:hypothetical protein